MEERTDNLATFFRHRGRASAAGAGMVFRQSMGIGSLTFGEWLERAEAIGAALAGMGVRVGDRVALMAGPSVESLLAQWAVALAGAVLVPIHHSLAQGDVRELLAEVAPAFLMVGDPELLERVRPVVGRDYKGRLAVLREECVPADTRSGSRPFLKLEDVVAARTEVASLAQLERLAGPGERASLVVRTEELAPESPAVIIYTAGTVAEQRGVVLSHAAMLYQARTLAFLLPVGPEDLQLLFLPLSHVLGLVAVLASVAAATPVALGGGIRSLLEDLNEFKPTFMVGVPRVYERMVDKLQSGMADFSAPWLELHRRGLAAGRKVNEARVAGRTADPLSRATLELARRTVFARVRELFGGRMRFLISGGAPLNSEIAHSMASFGIPLLDGFGLTESGGATHLNRFEEPRIGTVGQPLPMVQTRIGVGGEVLLRSPGLMTGYLGDEESTRAAIDMEGWLHTGDIGEVDERGCLRITGRLKNLIVTATGKNVLPARVEARLHEIPLVSHALVVGDGRPWLAALVTVSTGRLADWAARNAILCDDPANLRQDSRLYREIEAELEKINASLSPHERVRRFAVLDSEFSVGSGELTHDFKLRRAVVLQRYGDLIELLYRERY